ncbi:DoxX family protein [Chiayiivirga flava]|uniref:Putative oxidoreductase n=1 Tax=Chiayiivirga flava TaxID=659595 RepID=A0A7W8D7B1_9GAMM|nr:DoxX family protein [Chiayiivirga flava]MBB5209276.1 putative oxidoreductase [Chiayiivirga flava]
MHAASLPLRFAPASHSLALLILRVAAGGFLLPHGFGKLFGWFGGPGLTGFAAELQQFGLPAAAPLPLLLALVQAGVGVLLVLGLFTRPAAALGVAFLATTVPIARPAGWFWMHGGMEYPVFWTCMLLAVALIGAGAWSIDGRRQVALR